MTGRVLAAWVPLSLLAAGCLSESRSFMVTSGPSGEPVVARSLNPVQAAPATEEAGKRVIAVGMKIISANPQLGLRPAFCTAGTSQPEIFHRGTGGLEGCQVVVSEGMVRRCTTDGQLAAVLSSELGKVIAEREAQAGPNLRQPERRSISDGRIGNDYCGAFGPSDGTYMMEEASLNKQRGKRPAPLAPETLAKRYLVRAGYTESDLAQVQALLHEAEKNFTVEKGYAAAISKSAVAAPAVPPPPPAPQDPEKPAWKAAPTSAPK
jgi:hypothetical protein